MAATVAARRAQGEAKLLEPRLSGLIGRVPTPKRGLQNATLDEMAGAQWLLDILSASLDEWAPRSTAALVMCQDHGQLTNNLKRIGHLSATRLGLIADETFWRIVIRRLNEHFGLDNDEDRLKRALDGVQAGLSVIGEIAMKGVRR